MLFRNDDEKSRQRQRRQALRRHAQRRHKHFYNAWPDWSFIQNFRSAPVTWRSERGMISVVIGVLALLALVVLPSWAAVFGRGELPLGPSIALLLPPKATEAPSWKDDRQALINGVYTRIDEATMWTTITVEKGQTLGAIFAEIGVNASQLAKILEQMQDSRALTTLKPGEKLGVKRDAEGHLQAIQYDADSNTRKLVEWHGDRIQESTIERPLERRTHVASGVIESSLFAAADDAGLSDDMVVELAKVFGYDIDMAQDLRKGDKFFVVYEANYRDGEPVAGGRILAATFYNRAKRFEAVGFQRPGGDFEYYDQSGRPLRKDFIRTPVEFSRISSRFSSARKHPVLGTVRAHRGVDYAAPSGTPIIAASNGKVSFSGWQNGYGNVIILDHGRGYTTLYGHMSRRVANRGARVRQGEIIGYVGMTGLASGPHLHYEFRINGVHRDPLKVTMPPPERLPLTMMAAFQKASKPGLYLLARLEGAFPTTVQR